MTMTESRTHTPTEMAVRYRQGGETFEVPCAAEFIDDELGNLLVQRGIVGQVVTRPAVDWKVDAKRTAQFACDVAENVISDLSEGAITDEQAAEALRYLATGLLDPREVRIRENKGVRVEPDCTLAGWIERAVNLLEDCKKIADGFVKDPTGNVGADYDNHIAVLAGIADHYITNGCRNCETVTVNSKAEVAA